MIFLLACTDKNSVNSRMEQPQKQSEFNIAALSKDIDIAISKSKQEYLRNKEPIDKPWSKRRFAIYKSRLRQITPEKVLQRENLYNKATLLKLLDAIKNKPALMSTPHFDMIIRAYWRLVVHSRDAKLVKKFLNTVPVTHITYDVELNYLTSLAYCTHSSKNKRLAFLALFDIAQSDGINANIIKINLINSFAPHFKNKNSISLKETRKWYLKNQDNLYFNRNYIKFGYGKSPLFSDLPDAQLEKKYSQPLFTFEKQETVE